MRAVASHLYALGARVRRATARSRAGAVRRLDRPVISVGNLAVGGTGKTPLVGHLAQLLLDAGERPAVLSRGYRRTQPEDGVTVVSDGARLRADIDRAGDEPLMLARALPGVPVLVSADRYLAGRVAEWHLGATVHLLDDGFQHFALGRDLDLLVVDPSDLERPRTLPAGRLRESLHAARHADAVIVTDPSADAQALAARLGVAEGFTMVRTSGPASDDTFPGVRLVPPGSRVVVVSGIARPELFEEQTRAAGYDVAAALAFADHHPYEPADIARIAATVGEVGAIAVLTTEKDLMRLLKRRPWPFRVAVSQVSVRVEPERFAGWLLARLAAARGADRPETRA